MVPACESPQRMLQDSGQQRLAWEDLALGKEVLDEPVEGAVEAAVILYAPGTMYPDETPLFVPRAPRRVREGDAQAQVERDSTVRKRKNCPVRACERVEARA